MNNVRQTYLDCLALGIRKCWQDDQYTDVKLRVENKVFSCHKIILSSVSPYFHAMFSGGLRESKDEEIPLQDMEISIFEKFLSFVYSEQDIVTNENAFDLLKMASHYQVTCLQELCEEFLCEQVTPDNCLEMWKWARMLNCQILLKKTHPQVTEHFSNICRLDSFFTLDVDDLVIIIKDDNLVAVDEEQVCDAVIKWYEHKQSDRSQHLGKLFQHIRLPRVSPEYIVSVLEPVLQDRDCKTYLDEARNFHMLPARQQEFCSERVALRCNDDLEEVLLVVTEFDAERSGSFYQDGKCLWAFSFQQSRWFTLSPIPIAQNPGIDFAVALYANDLYLSGGTLTPKCLLKHESERNEWIACESVMKRGRYHHCMCAVRDCLYILGGYNIKLQKGSQVLGSIEEYSIKGRRWRTVGELAQPVFSASSVVVAEKIYVFGGSQQDDQKTGQIQYFDTRHRDALLVTTNPSLTQRIHTIPVGRKVFLITTEGELYEFKDGSDCQLVCRLEETVSPLGATHYRGNLILLYGSEGKETQFNKIVKLDDAMTAAVIPAKVNICPKPIHACARTVINKQFLYHTYFQ